MTGETAIFSHWIAAASYTLLAILVLLIGKQRSLTTWLALAAGVHALWAAALAYAITTGGHYALVLTLGETLRSGAWIVFIGVMMKASWADESRNPSRQVILSLYALIALQLALDLVTAAGYGLTAPLPFLVDLSRVAVAIGGLVLTHNLYVSSAPANRWSLSTLCLALAGLFAYDLNWSTLALLDPALSIAFFDARGAANALVTPLFLIAAVRNRNLSMQLSRQAAFQTFALGAIGIYLIGMSIAAYLLGFVGGDWGRLLQILLVFAAVVIGGIVLLSGRARAWIRVKINKHFFAYKYDYREEWLRFISTVARSGPGFGSLSERVIQAIASIVDSPGGILFRLGGDDRFEPAAQWNFRSLTPEGFSLPPELRRLMTEEGRILVAEGDVSARFAPDMAAHPGLWLLVPLIHLEEPIGVILLEQPRAARDLDWEDFDILRTVGRQGASYIAEQTALASLEESRKFEEFNRRFAFIMHDIKNLVSQLSLLARNAERHADNPDFRSDMVATLKSSVGKMNDLLVRLGQTQGAPRTSQTFDLRAMASGLQRAKVRTGANVILDADDYPLQIEGDGAKIEQAVEHIVQNALDASAEGAPVHIRLRNEAGAVTLIVDDRGTGMTAEFVREELFKPFRSTKPAGFGIGAYEARELLKGEGATLEVLSRPGEGSSFIVRFPIRATTESGAQE